VEASPLTPFPLSIPHAACKHHNEHPSSKRPTEIGRVALASQEGFCCVKLDSDRRNVFRL
jgi:hypothetical protein